MRHCGLRSLPSVQDLQRYLAPEILDETMVGERFESYRVADCYPLGLIAWEIAMRTSVNGGGCLVVVAMTTISEPCEEKSLPFHEYVDREPNLVEMREVVAVQNRRPHLKAEWSLDPVSRKKLLEVRFFASCRR